MSTQDVYSQYKISDKQVAVLASFTLAAITKMAQGAARAEAQKLGLPANPITITNGQVKQELADFAQKKATQIQSGFNSALSAQLSKLDDAGSDQQIVAQLAPFLAGIHAYNQTTMLPFVNDKAHALGVKAFWVNSTVQTPDGEQSLASQTLWDWTINDDHPCEDCIALADDSPYDGDTAATMEHPPRHPHCLCRFEPEPGPIAAGSIIPWNGA